MRDTGDTAGVELGARPVFNTLTQIICIKMS